MNDLQLYIQDAVNYYIIDIGVQEARDLDQWLYDSRLGFNYQSLPVAFDPGMIRVPWPPKFDLRYMIRMGRGMGAKE